MVTLPCIVALISLEFVTLNHKAVCGDKVTLFEENYIAYHQVECRDRLDPSVPDYKYLSLFSDCKQPPELLLFHVIIGCSHSYDDEDS